MRVPGPVIFLLCVTVASVQARPKTATQAETPKATPKALGQVPAPIKSKALLAAEKRIADLESELQAAHTDLADWKDFAGHEIDQRKNTEDQLDAAKAELNPFKQLMANIAAITVPLSQIAPENTIGSNRVMLIVDPREGLMWPAKKPNGQSILVGLDPNSPISVKDLLAIGYQSAARVGDLEEATRVTREKYEKAGQALVDQYNVLLNEFNALAKLATDLVVAEEAAEHRSKIGDALLLGLSKFRTLRPPPIFCTSTAVFSSVYTNCY